MSLKLLLLIALVFGSCTDEVWSPRRMLLAKVSTPEDYERCNHLVSRMSTLITERIPEVRELAEPYAQQMAHSEQGLIVVGVRCIDPTSSDTLVSNYHRIMIGWSVSGWFYPMDTYLVSEDFQTLLVYDRDHHRASNVADVRASGRWQREWK